MVPNPLSYDSLKCVLQYMEANKRFHVSRCCPLIRSGERATQLNIDYLEFEPGKIRINNTTYSIGIYKKYHVGETPEPFEVQNDKGGVMFDVDKFGIEDRNDSFIVTPGDVEIGREFRQTDGGLIMHGVIRMTIDELEQSIQVHERQLESRGLLPDFINEELLREQRKKELISQQAMLISLQYERDNAPTPFENLIQLNARSEESTYFDRYKHSKKYHEAVKQLGMTLFGGRNQLINVKSFRQIGSHIVIRLPIGVQFKIRNMRFRGSVANECNALSSIIHTSSYPLEHLHVEFFHTEEVGHPIVRDAKLLSFSPLPFNFPFRTLLALTNRKVNITDLRSLNFSVDVLKNSIRVWKERGLPVGTQFTFEMPAPDVYQARREAIQRQFDENAMEYQKPGSAWMDELKREFNGVAGLGSVIIPMGVDTQLVVSHKESFDADSNRQSDVVEVLVEANNQ